MALVEPIMNVTAQVLTAQRYSFDGRNVVLGMRKNLTHNHRNVHACQMQQ